MKELIGIPYKYNSASMTACDCWGLVYLYYQQLGIDLPLFAKYYEQCPESATDFTVLARLITASSFGKVNYLVWHDVVIGFSDEAFGFGIYVGNGEILTTFHTSGSQIISWEDWKSKFKSNHLYRHQKIKNHD